MREKQRAYFKTRSYDLLCECKQLEQDVNERLAVLRTHGAAPEKQLDLFGQGTGYESNRV